MTKQQAEQKNRARERDAFKQKTMFYYRFRREYGDIYKKYYKRYRELGGKLPITKFAYKGKN